MKSVLISIKPKWCELIVNGQKTVEVRKTRPKTETPFKCYIYETKGKVVRTLKYPGDIRSMKYHEGEGKVIGEFVCDEVYQIPIFDGIVSSMDVVMSCLDDNEILEYAGEKPVYAWHISDLKIYDKPKELNEFYIDCNQLCFNCENLVYQRVNAAEFEYDCKNRKRSLTRPPQSWCYVEEYNGS